MDKNAIKKYKVLYAEDEPSVQQSTLEFLSRFFDDITVASNGQEGLEKFEASKFDIVITDIKMPKMNGCVMSQKIKELDKDVSLIILTASDSGMDVSDCDYDIYLQKPIQFSLFIEALTKIHEERNSKK